MLGPHYHNIGMVAYDDALRRGNLHLQGYFLGAYHIIIADPSGYTPSPMGIRTTRTTQSGLHLP